MKERMRNRFRALAVVQVMLLLASTSAFSWMLLTSDLVAVPVIIAGVILIQVLILLRFVEVHVDTLEEFFSAINYEDFTQHFITDDIDAELKSAFNKVIERFQDARADREVQANYLEVVVRHVPVPLMAVRGDGSIRLLNNPLRKMTGIPTLTKLEDLAALDKDLPVRMREIEPGQQRLLQATIRDVPVELRVAVSEIRLGGIAERLYSVENLSGELTARESSAWRNLIRVLTHEIMNTLTPVSSLAQTAVGLIEKPGAQEDLREAIETISRRSHGLMNFVSRYRELLKVPEPVPTDLMVGDVVTAVTTLMADSLQHCELTVDVPDSLEVRADPQLLDQLLVNIVKNAIEASAEASPPIIQISAKLEYGRIIIRIGDNGPGIDEAIADQLFIPFFTTKRDGSGIGLSLARQIMTAHGGEIAINRRDGLTIVSLVF